MFGVTTFRTENVYVMGPTKREKKRDARAGDFSRPLPKKFICINTDEIAQVLGYLNDSGTAEDNEVGAIHLELCRHCQETAKRFRPLRRAVMAQRQHRPHPAAGVKEDGLAAVADGGEIVQANAATVSRREQTEDQDASLSVEMQGADVPLSMRAKGGGD